MSQTLQIQAIQTQALQTQALQTQTMSAIGGGAMNIPHPTSDPKAAKSVAQQFESVFITQMMGEMFEGISTDGPFGGGQGEAMFRSLMMDEYGKQLTAQGGFGLSDIVTRQLLKHQEQAQ